MSIIIISKDVFWKDALQVSLGLLFPSPIISFSYVCSSLENLLLNSSSDSVLIVDSGLPGLDYWEFARWLGDRYSGRTIMLTADTSYDIYSSKMLLLGCFAVLDKSKGFYSCWHAIHASLAGDVNFVEDESSPFDLLSPQERSFAKQLLIYDIQELASRQNVSQQAVNKRKLALYRKLRIESVPTDKTYRLLAQLFGLSRSESR